MRRYELGISLRGVLVGTKQKQGEVSDGHCVPHHPPACLMASVHQLFKDQSLPEAFAFQKRNGLNSSTCNAGR
ncbi:hypothetical protein TNIN_235281 [Trichonephila inaurata madagascariensis]|uniref:Uncharacterized protein n=1 Tax=Trichonephila inaurata madagascariensis TaxID=2747483 RepID=A0A8X7BPT3_9ARAC|nr:hypothetical protein TNIN_235281 [Trichonephila inaurata madagascariensis]